MLHLIYQAVRGVVAHFHWAAACGLAPALLAGALAWQFARGQWPGWIYVAALAPMLCLHTMYTVAWCRRLALPHLDESFITAMIWDQRKTEFLVINSVGFIVFGLIVFLLANWASSFYIFSLELERAPPQRPTLPFADSYRAGAAAVVFFGSRALAAVFGAIALFIWLILLRWVIKLPAAAVDRYISFEEAEALTRGHVLQILAANGLLNAGLIIALSILKAAAVDALGGEPPWLIFAAVAGGYWTLSAFNISLWKAMYDRYTSGYKLRPEYYWKQ